MKLKDRIKTYNFWVSLSSAVFLIIKVLGSQIGFKVDESLFSDLITSLCSILVILGIIVPPTKIANKDSALTVNSLESNTLNNNSNITESQENSNYDFKNSTTEIVNFSQENSADNPTTADNLISINDSTTVDNLIIADNLLTTEPNSKTNLEFTEQNIANPLANAELSITNTINDCLIENEQNNQVQSNEENSGPVKNQIEEIDLNNESNDSINSIEDNSSNQIELTKSKFQNQLKIQENLFANNIEEYIRILEIELASLKNK